MNDTKTMLAALERAFIPSTTLVDTFFPNVITFATNQVEVEYKKGSRKMAPFVVNGAGGINMARGGSKISAYTPPIVKPKRVINVNDVTQRGFGENVYSSKTPQQRAQEMRARDLTELVDSCTRRQEWMASQILLNGKCECSGFADDGKEEIVDTITFPDWDGKITLSGTDTWDNKTAKIYDSIGDASQTIRRNAGLVPTVAIASSNVFNYLIDNEQLYKYLLLPNKDTPALLTLQPKLENPGLMRIGYIQSLNLEIYTYDGIFVNDNGAIEQYIPDDYFVIGVPGRGKRLFGSVTHLEGGNHVTYEGAYVPKVTTNEENDTSALTVSSRCVLCPEFADDWVTIKVK